MSLINQLEIESLERRAGFSRCMNKPIWFDMTVAKSLEGGHALSDSVLVISHSHDALDGSLADVFHSAHQRIPIIGTILRILIAYNTSIIRVQQNI